METKTHSAHPNPSVAKRDVRSVRKGIFRKEGEYWTLGYGANVFRLKDSKGLAYFAYLLRNPGTEFHALDVVGGIAVHSQEGQTNLSIPGLPYGDEHLDQAGISIGSQGDAGERLIQSLKLDGALREFSDLAVARPIELAVAPVFLGDVAEVIVRSTASPF